MWSLLVISDPTSCSKFEWIALEKFHLMLFFLLDPFLLLLLLLNLILLQLVQHVTERAVHLSYGPVEASNDSPCT